MTDKALEQEAVTAAHLFYGRDATYGKEKAGYAAGYIAGRTASSNLSFDTIVKITDEMWMKLPCEEPSRSDIFHALKDVLPKYFAASSTISEGQGEEKRPDTDYGEKEKAVRWVLEHSPFWVWAALEQQLSSQEAKAIAEIVKHLHSLRSAMLLNDMGGKKLTNDDFDHLNQAIAKAEYLSQFSSPSSPVKE